VTQGTKPTPREWFVEAFLRGRIKRQHPDEIWEAFCAFAQQRLKEDYPDSSYAALVFDGGDGEIIGLEMHE